MARVRCPKCGTSNPAPAEGGAVTCSFCHAHFRVVDDLSEPVTPWKPRSRNPFERLIETFDNRNALIAATVGLLLFFLAFWGVLHVVTRPEPRKTAISNDTVSPDSGVVPGDALVSTSPPPPPPPAAPIVPKPPAVTAPAAPRIIGIPHPVPQAPPDAAPALADKTIGDAIAKGVDYLIANFSPALGVVKTDEQQWPRGLNQLCIYALLQSSQAITDPRLNPTTPFMSRVIESMKRLPDDPMRGVYGRSLRASSLALLNRPADRGALENDVLWLLRAERDGAYTYVSPPTPPKVPIDWDNSNSQYGLYGVWSGAEVGIPVSRGYWEAVQRHWSGCQAPNGSFGYKQGGSDKLSMTVAGVASLFVAHDYLVNTGAAGIDSRTPALKKALNWLDSGDRILSFDLNDPISGGYTLYGVARAALASGNKYFGAHDWYLELAPVVLKNQRADGSFNGRLIDTAFSLLFLARGRHPILFNKLSLPGMVVNHPRDAANLARYATRQIERTFNSQVVPLHTSWAGWSDAPILYMAASAEPELATTDYDEIRQFVQAGGLLVTNADGNSASFNAFVPKLAARLFPEHPLADLPPTSLVYESLFKPKPPPPLKGVSNGVRLLMVHSLRDLARSWDIHDWSGAETVYQLGVNLFVYAAGKQDYRNRLDTNYLAPPSAPAAFRLPVARLRYAGQWDPEPFAWTHFSRRMRRQTNFEIDPVAVDVRLLTPAIAPIAALTGTAGHEFSPEEVAAVQRYVQGGGVLMIDSCGGGMDFASSENALLAAAFPNVTPTPLAIPHPLLRAGAPGMEDLPKPLSRSFGSLPSHPAIFAYGKGHVITTPLDLTFGLLDTGTLGIVGYNPAYAQSFVKNLVLWTLNGQLD